MDLTTSPEQQLLAATARSFVSRRCPPSRARAIAADPSMFDPELWRSMVELGWPGLAIGEAHGGAGGGVLDAAILCEALGRGPVPSPIVATTAAALLLAEGDRRGPGDDWLRRIASGEAVATTAVIEAGAPAGPVGPGLCGTGPLHGTKLLVPWAGVADLLIVSTADGFRLVHGRAAGLRSRRHDDLGGDPRFEVELDSVLGEPLEVPPEAAVRAADVATVLELASVVGGADRVLEMTVEHARDRHQFGRPIGSFQAVAHRCVDMRAELDACRYLTYRAAWALDRRLPTDLPVGAAKAYANDALRRIFGHAHQVHGAIGFSTEHDLHLFTRRAKAFELSHGWTAQHLDRVADAMGLG